MEQKGTVAPFPLAHCVLILYAPAPTRDATPCWALTDVSRHSRAAGLNEEKVYLLWSVAFGVARSKKPGMGRHVVAPANDLAFALQFVHVVELGAGENVPAGHCSQSTKDIL